MRVLEFVPLNPFKKYLGNLMRYLYIAVCENAVLTELCILHYTIIWVTEKQP